MRMDGLLHFNEIFEDAEDVIQIYKETGTNPVAFPDEENFTKIQRFKSCRSVYGDYHPYMKQ